MAKKKAKKSKSFIVESEAGFVFGVDADGEIVFTQLKKDANKFPEAKAKAFLKSLSDDGIKAEILKL